MSMATQQISDPSEDVLGILRSRQNWAGRILELAEHLDSGDRALLRGIYHHGMTASAFARAVGAHRRSVALRVRRLVNRITSPTYQRVLALRRSWPAQRRVVAEAIFLRGLSQREAARHLDLSLHRIRRECDRIRAIIEISKHIETVDARR